MLVCSTISSPPSIDWLADFDRFLCFDLPAKVFADKEASVKEIDQRTKSTTLLVNDYGEPPYKFRVPLEMAHKIYNTNLSVPISEIISPNARASELLQLSQAIKSIASICRNLVL